jgi:hypothetical protein
MVMRLLKRPCTSSAKVFWLAKSVGKARAAFRPADPKLTKRDPPARTGVRDIRGRWKICLQKAKSIDDFERFDALSWAVTQLELAAKATSTSGKKRSEGLADWIMRACPLEQESSGFNLKRFVRELQLTAATQARNAATHEHRVPPASECRSHVETLRTAWLVLQKSFVSRDSAGDVAQRFLAKPGVSDVFLFGSLAHVRRKKKPWDIDLLIMDNGEYSLFAPAYLAQFSPHPASTTFGEVELISKRDRAAVQCGWLDFVMVDRNKFGVDRSHTLMHVRRQSDPLFFVKISEHMLHYDQDRKSWIPPKHALTTRLKDIRRNLDISALVDLRKGRRPHLP